MQEEIIEPKIYLEDFLSKLIKNEEKISGVNLKVQYDFTSDNNGKWYFTIANGRTEGIIEGTVDNPTCTFVAKYLNFYNTFTGKLNVNSSFLSGKIKLKGDMGTAIKLQQWAT